MQTGYVSNARAVGLQSAVLAGRPPAAVPDVPDVGTVTFAETLISRSVAIPALDSRPRLRETGNHFHEPAFFNQLVDFSDSCSDDSRNCHTALLGEPWSSFYY